jgi:hypothetical protein
MASTTSQAQLLSVPEPVEQDEVSNRISAVHDCALDEPHRRVMKKKTETATGEKPSIASDEIWAQRWRALDHLLLMSFALISPPYLFISFPPDD